MPNKPNRHTLPAGEQDLRARLETAEESLREILSGESDALFVAGPGGAQLFTLKGADQSYRTLIENMSEGALTLTSTGLIVYANRRFAEMLGTPLEKVVGSEIHSWFAPESRQIVQTLLKTDAVDNRREELALIAADGTQVPVNLSVSHLKQERMPDSFCMVATDLTEQKRNETILAADKLERAILEQSADAIVICDETGRVLRASKQAQALYGNNPRGQHFGHAFPLRHSDGTAFSPIGDIDISPRQSVEASLEHNGQAFDLLVSVGHLRGARAELLGSVVTLTDITAIKQAEEALRRSESEFRTLAESMPQIVWITRPDGWNIYFNHQWMDYTGLTLEESTGHGWKKAFHPDDQQRAWTAWQRAIAEIGIYSIESRLRRADGIYRWWLVRGVPLKDAAGNIAKWFGTCTDIHDLKTAELEISSANRELRESERRFTDMLENVELVSLMLDHEARITYCNDYLLRLTGWRPEDVVGRDWFQLFIPPDINDEVKPIFRKIVAGLSGEKHHEHEILTRSGERRLIRWNNSVLRSGAGDVIGTASIGEDITEKKRAEISIHRLNRVYALLSAINTLIVRVRDRDELFKLACRIAIEAGGFRMALIAILDRGAMKVVPAASAGMDDEFLIALEDRFSLVEDVPMGSTLPARAIQEKKVTVVNDVQNDPKIIFGKKYAELGVRSLAIFPLMVSDEAVGVLVLYSDQIDFFGEEEMKLLIELAGDIGYAMDHIEKAAKIDYLAYYDALTGLANRTLLLDRLAQYMRSAVSGGHKLALFLTDLERFKNINDSLGQPAGDALLRQVAQWLTAIVGDANLVARLGADHFAVVLPEVKHDGDVARLLEKTMRVFLDHPFRLNDAVFRIAAKVGVALFPDDGADADALFKNAEAALKKAKARGDRYLFFTQEMTEAVAGELTLENQLRQALDNEEFVLHYQPKVNLASGKVTSAEALIRWNDPRMGLMPPDRFIPILEETGMIYEVGRWALRKAIEDYLRWRAAGLPAVRIAVNVSALQLRDRGFIDEIKQVIGIDAQAVAGLELELTESLIMADIKLSIASLQAIRALGVSIAIDDFGTGFSSLSYLSKLPVDALKIDRSFVTNMTVAPEGLALVSTIINLSHSLKLKVVAEGVETEAQSRLLRLLDCDEMQGFLFSKPVPVDIFEARFLASEARA